MSKFLFLAAALSSFLMIACTKQAEVARPTEHNLQRQEEVDQRDLLHRDNIEYRESRDMPDGTQVYDEEIEVDEE